MTAPDRNTLRPTIEVKKYISKKVQINLSTEHVEAAITDWLTTHYAEFRNLDLEFDWPVSLNGQPVHVTGYGQPVQVTGYKETNS